MTIQHRKGKSGRMFWWNSVAKRFATKAERAGAQGSRKGGTRARHRTGTAMTHRPSAAPSHSGGHKRKGGGRSRSFLSSLNVSSLASFGKELIPSVAAGLGGFIGVRWLSSWGLSLLGPDKETGLSRDQGWMGYVAQGLTVILGFLLLKRIAPKYAWAFAIGGGISIGLRAWNEFMGDDADQVDESGGAGVTGITRRAENEVRGITQRRAA